MKITMKKIARMANVDISTVSRALNNDRNISAEQKRKIVGLANNFNYIRRKITGRTILFIIDKKYFLLTNNFYNSVIESIDDELRSRGYCLRFQTVNHAVDLPEQVDIKMVAGVIITGCYHDEFLKKAKAVNMPVVLFDYYLPGQDIPSVLIDNTYGIIKGVEYLTSLGHQRVVYLKGDTDNDIGSMDRLAGYKMAVEKFGLDNDPSLILACNFSMRSAYEAMKNFLNLNGQRAVSAVMAVNDMVAIGAMEAIKEKKIKIPADISVLGFDDISLAAETIPSLSTIHVRRKTMGVLTAKTLLDMINGKELMHCKVVIKPNLVVRETTGATKKMAHFPSTLKTEKEWNI